MLFRTITEKQYTIEVNLEDYATYNDFSRYIYDSLCNINSTIKEKLNDNYIIYVYNETLITKKNYNEIIKKINNDTIINIIFQKLYNKIYTTDYAFALINKNGDVITWGNPSRGGDSSKVQHLLKDIKEIYTTHGSFTALTVNDDIITWGKCNSYFSKVQHKLINIKEIYSNYENDIFIAIDENNYAISWGFRDDKFEIFLKIKKIYYNGEAGAALYENGDVETWGDPYNGGDSNDVKHLLKNIKEIYYTREAFIAINENNHIITWGQATCGAELPDSLL